MFVYLYASVCGVIKNNNRDNRQMTAKKTLTFDGRRFCIPKFRVFYDTADDTLLVISDVLLQRNQSQRSCFAVIG